MDEVSRWARTEEIFHKALEHPADARADFVTRACAGDGDLERRVSALLRAEGQVKDFLDTPVARVTDLAFEEGSSDTMTIGPYRVIRPLGAGGMGEVFLGVDQASAGKHFVAIKLLRADVGTRFTERFDRERQILAQLIHPGIARFIGTGTMADGRPYYVMERVEGDRIDEYCRRRLLNVRERVALVREVCLAVQHAHANLVVHRDLKPGNILVTADGTPKLLDFGIAKPVSDDVPDLTRTTDLLATPEYAAPEQLRGAPTTTATDVYALGVLLYELLSGHRPFTAGEARIRSEADRNAPPTPPSIAAAGLGVRRLPDGEEETITPEDVSGQRRTVPSGLRRALRGDLDNIILKAMRLAPEERYVSAAALADDLDRYLTRRPVRARPTSVTDRTAKFIGRNRVGSAVSLALVATLVGATIVTQRQNLEIAASAARLTSERDRAVAVQGFLLESFGAAGDHGVVGDSLTVRQVLDRQAEEIERRSGENAVASRFDPVQTEMLHVLADGYERLGAFEEAERWAQRAVAVRRAEEPEATRDLARSVGLLGWIQHERSDLEPAEANLRASLALWRDVETDSVGLSRALNDLGAALSTRGKLEESEAMLQEALSIRRSIYLPSDRAIAITLNNLASTLSLKARNEEALTLYQMAATSLESSLGPDHPRTLLARLNVAGTHGLLGNYEVWADEAGEVSAAFDRLGRTDVHAGRAHESYGRALGFLGRFDDSQAAVERALAIFQEQLGDHLLTARAQYFMSTLRNAMRSRDESLEYARASVATFRKVLDGDHPELAEALRLVGTQTTSRPEQINAYREASEMLTRIEGEDGAGAVRLTLSLARALVADRQFEEALAAFQALARSVPVAYGDDHAYAPAPYLGMAEALLGMNEGGAAENALETAREKLVGSADVDTNRAWVARLESAVAASRAQGVHAQGSSAQEGRPARRGLARP